VAPFLEYFTRTNQECTFLLVPTKFQIPVRILQNTEFCWKLLPVRLEPSCHVLFLLDQNLFILIEDVTPECMGVTQNLTVTTLMVSQKSNVPPFKHAMCVASAVSFSFPLVLSGGN
jgi:hypothetical protein